MICFQLIHYVSYFSAIGQIAATLGRRIHRCTWPYLPLAMKLLWLPPQNEVIHVTVRVLDLFHHLFSPELSRIPLFGSCRLPFQQSRPLQIRASPTYGVPETVKNAVRLRRKLTPKRVCSRTVSQCSQRF